MQIFDILWPDIKCEIIIRICYRSSDKYRSHISGAPFAIISPIIDYYQMRHLSNEIENNKGPESLLPIVNMAH